MTDEERLRDIALHIVGRDTEEGGFLLNLADRIEAPGSFLVAHSPYDPGPGRELERGPNMKDVG